MKRVENYKLLTTGLFIMAFLLNACVKNRSGETDFSGLKPVVLIPEGGLAAFTGAALTFPGTDVSDTAFFHVNYAATNVAPQNETVTLGVDQAALQTYNNSSSIQFALFPDSTYSFTSTSVTVPKGNNYTANIPLVVYPDKIDPTKSYMLPISIKGGPAGSTISGNFGTIYYHVIGNPIAGSYNTWRWRRWNAADSSGAPAYDFQYGPAVFAPDDPTTVEVGSGYYNGPRYVISFTDNGGVLSNFKVSLNPADLTTWSGAGITLTGGPTIMAADPVNGFYQFTYSVIAGGNPRTLIDTYSKQ
ncbi:MAG TPA: DUF1735 domain-containing protein [Puia sp.]|nr:DUF1735 domain-containing protein [Puia sp.]